MTNDMKQVEYFHSNACGIVVTTPIFINKDR